MPTLLVIDDEQSVRYSFQRVFEGNGVTVLTARTGQDGLQQIREKDPDVVVLDLQLPDRSGLEVFKDIHALDAKRPVIFITAHGTTETAIEAMKLGAFDYLVKPVDLEKVSQVLTRAYEAARLMQVPAVLPTEDRGDRIIGRSLAMQEMCKAIGKIAPQDVNVLILGESGTGKELVARALYQHSRRADKPFLAINCAALPETLLESELFGHEQGAFTGAVRRRIGKFEQCDKGTLFLDEIGDMAPNLQAKMLRVLQDQRFERLGSNEMVQTHVRVIAATNHELEKLVDEGKFRKDLYYRLNVVSIKVPPLRNRLDDVPELAHYFLYRYDREMGTDLRAFAPETLEILQNYSWPGNVRELQSVIQQSILNAAGQILFPEFLPESLLRKKDDANRPYSAQTLADSGLTRELEAMIDSLLAGGKGTLYQVVIETVERILIQKVLEHTHGHQTQTSELLGLNRTTIRHKMRELGLGIDKSVTEEGAREGKREA
jgi:two-component system nitrogen regulation response regulator GlnG